VRYTGKALIRLLMTCHCEGVFDRSNLVIRRIKLEIATSSLEDSELLAMAKYLVFEFKLDL